MLELKKEFYPVNKIHYDGEFCFFVEITYKLEKLQLLMYTFPFYSFLT